MPVQEIISSYNHPLDVLKRFMPAPIKGTVSLDGEIVSIETNYSQFIASLQNSNFRSSPSEPVTFQWKLLFDDDVHVRIAEPAILVTQNLIIVSMGPALFAGLDVEHRELLAFIGGAVSTQEYENVIAPLFIGLTKFALGKEPMPVISALQNRADGCTCNA